MSKPALCLLISISMKACMTHILAILVHEILSVLYFAIFFGNGRGRHFGWSICVKSDINLEQIHLQIILIERD